MFYKKMQQKINGLWYPHSITWGKAITTDQISDQLALLSTVTRGDAYAIMKNLGGVLSNYMAQGRTVKLDGVGTFYYTAAANKQGVKTAKEVSASQIVGVRVRFIPEVGRDVNRKVVTRSMGDNNICWEEWGKTSTPGSGNSGGNTGGDDSDNPGGSDGDQSENPLG